MEWNSDEYNPSSQEYISPERRQYILEQQEKDKAKKNSAEAISDPQSQSEPEYLQAPIGYKEPSRVLSIAEINANIREALSAKDKRIAELEANLVKEETQHLETIKSRDAHEERINEIAAMLLDEEECSWSSANDPGENAINGIASLQADLEQAEAEISRLKSFEEFARNLEINAIIYLSERLWLPNDWKTHFQRIIEEYGKLWPVTTNERT